MIPGDLADIAGRETARRALEVAAAGGHSLMLFGPVGTGKTRLALCLPGILPPLTREEASEVAALYATAACEAPAGRPFRRPPPGISVAGLVGGGRHPRPGEASLAHHGALFLDELPAFRRATLAALRRPLEDGFVTVAGLAAYRRFPACFLLIAAMAPCPCGRLGDYRVICRCPPSRIERYRERSLGALCDRFDLQIEVPPLLLPELCSRSGEASAAVAERVRQARARQRERFGPCCPAAVNAAMEPAAVRRFCHLDGAGQALLARAGDSPHLAAGAVIGILKVARTLADLAGSETLQPVHLAEALAYRTLARLPPCRAI